ncbi:MAG: serine/threonine protein kinase [Verrucomicrobia bacterium]|nr:serine/threonine protein kinase [Verrucomicrobiota bacterium]MDA1087987.1 serine/threonine protein kinase [Verrucomicrobiota bacterium]
MSNTVFAHLTMDVVIDLTESAIGRRCTNLCRPLNSYINRVYEVETENGDMVVTKFFRPGRWSRDAIQNELEFVFDLREADVPVILPFGDDPANALHEADGMIYTVYPKKGGRVCDEPSDDEWKQLGRLIGRMHQVGVAGSADHRIRMHPNESTEQHLTHIMESGEVDLQCEEPYEGAADRILDIIIPLFEDVPELRIHGDLHPQNIIHRPGESFYLIDFDDMVRGPAVQDIWMLMPGRVPDCARELQLFLSGYETFREFDYQQLRLVEPLRAMRFIHYTSWCVHQCEDGTITRLAADWGTAAYWKQETEALETQLIEIQDSLN